jgi:uncharacterized protein YqjF (DUF2071 family)
VGFRFLGTRVLGVPIPFHQSFDEVNLRFYVRRDTGAERRRGVAFIREIVPRRAVAAVARFLYSEPYVALSMRSVIRPDSILAVSYAWRRAGRWHTLTAQSAPPSTRPADGSLEQFIAEHYWGYTRQRTGATLEYQVTHPPWMVAPADTHRIDADLAAVYGRDFASVLRQPTSVFLADGSAVTVSSPCPVSPETAP